jgi:hypothetical protein
VNSLLFCAGSVHKEYRGRTLAACVHKPSNTSSHRTISIKFLDADVHHLLHGCFVRFNDMGRNEFATHDLPRPSIYVMGGWWLWLNTGWWWWRWGVHTQLIAAGFIGTVVSRRWVSSQHPRIYSLSHPYIFNSLKSYSYPSHLQSSRFEPDK